MGYLHERGVKGYVTLNVLLFNEELEQAEQTIRTIASSGADAVIVQVHAHNHRSTHPYVGEAIDIADVYLQHRTCLDALICAKMTHELPHDEA